MDAVDDVLQGAPGNTPEAEAPLPVPAVPSADEADSVVHLGVMLRLEVVHPPGIVAGGRPGWIGVVTLHTTACCSITVVDITFTKYQFTNITSL